jgi:kynureninase
LKADLPRFAGWWGHDKATRFKMGPEFSPMPTAEGWQVSNAPVFNMAVHRVSLEQFGRAGMGRLRAKAVQLTGYAEALINAINTKHRVRLEIITPSDPEQRGCQLSIFAHGMGKDLFDKLTAQGISLDWREPNVIRMAPVPMYNSFEDVWRFGEALESQMNG